MCIIFIIYIYNVEEYIYKHEFLAPNSLKFTHCFLHLSRPFQFLNMCYFKSGVVHWHTAALRPFCGMRVKSALSLFSGE